MRLLVGSLLAWALAVATPCGVASEFRLGYPDQENYPFFIGLGAEVPAAPGMAVELVQRATRDAGREPVITRLPNVRVYQGLKDGRLDAYPCISYTEERAAYLAYPMRDGKLDASRRCFKLSYAIYQLRGGKVQWDGRTLGVDGPVGANRSFSIAGRLRELGANVEELPSEQHLFAMLELRRLSAVATLENIGDHHVARSGNAARFEKLPLPLSTRDYFLAVTRAFYASDPQFVERLWNRIGELRDATFDELTPKYVR